MRESDAVYVDYSKLILLINVYWFYLVYSRKPKYGTEWGKASQGSETVPKTKRMQSTVTGSFDTERSRSKDATRQSAVGPLRKEPQFFT